MLVRRLKRGDRLTIEGGDAGPVEIDVRGAGDNSLKLAINAPSELKVNHMEAADRDNGLPSEGQRP